MVVREAIATHTVARDLCLKSAPNWTAVIFLGILSGLHFAIGIPALFLGRWGYMSLILGIALAAASILAYLARYELTIMPADKTLRVRHGWGPFRISRFIPFSDVHAVRLTLIGGKRVKEWHIQLLCDNEDIECPPTDIPRQQALCLAVTMGVALIKVSDDDSSDSGDRMF